MVSNNYFSEEHKNKLVAILQASNAQIGVLALYEMAIHGYDLTPLAPLLTTYSLDNLKGDFLVCFGIAAHKLAKKNVPEALTITNSVKERLAAEIDSPKKFSDFYVKVLMRKGINLQEFHEAFGELVEQLPCPLEGAEEAQNYRRIYLEYFQEALRGPKFTQFFQKHETAITWSEHGDLLSQHVRGDPRELEWRREIIFGLARRISALVESKDKQAINGVIEFLGKYCRFAVGGSLEGNALSSLFRIIQTLVGRLEIVQ